MLRIVLLLLVIAGVAGYFTRPDEPKMREAADAVLSDVNSVGDLVDAGQSLIGDRAYSNYYVAAKYSVTQGGEALVDCWGAFTQVQCSRAEPAAN